MPLPSQTARTTSAGRSPMFRKRRRSPRSLVIAGGAIFGVLGLWWLWPSGTQPVPDPPPSLSQTTEQAADAGPATGLAPPAEITFPPPTVISFSRPLDLEVHRADPDPEPAKPAVEPTAPPPAPAVAERTEPAPATAEPTPAAPKTEPEAPPPIAPTPSSLQALPADLQALLSTGRQKLAAEPVAARQLLARALIDPRTPESERAALRDQLTKLNDDLVFSPRMAKDDPFVGSYAVQSGDALEKIARKENLSTHWRLIQRVNRLANANRIQLNQKLKLVKGPFHAVVIKSAFRMDLYMGDSAHLQDWVYVRSFRVGLGEGGSTPTGDFLVKRGSKLENPYWTNPRTGERFSKDDPKNPIGERWIGLEGLGEAAANSGYGIHGTIDPESIGREMSMGCVRMGSEDVELVYDLLGEGASVVRIVP